MALRKIVEIVKKFETFHRKLWKASMATSNHIPPLKYLFFFFFGLATFRIYEKPAASPAHLKCWYKWVRDCSDVTVHVSHDQHISHYQKLAALVFFGVFCSFSKYCTDLGVNLRRCPNLQHCVNKHTNPQNQQISAFVEVATLVDDQFITFIWLAASGFLS